MTKSSGNSVKKLYNHILAIVFTVALLVSIIGIPVNDHYCGGSFITTTVGLSNEDPCGEMPMEEDCCNDQVELFSVTDFFSNPEIKTINNTQPVVLVCSYTACTKLIPQPVKFKSIAEHIPPLIESRIFVEIQSFIL